MEDLLLQLYVRPGREAALWFEDARTHTRLAVRDTFWRRFIDALRDEGQQELAERLQAALTAVLAARRKQELLLECMRRLYSEEECRRCQLLIQELFGEE